MFSFKDKCYFTIETIETSDNYIELFDSKPDEEMIDKCNQVIGLLSRRIKEDDSSEFSERKQDLLVEVFSFING